MKFFEVVVLCKFATITINWLAVIERSSEEQFLGMGKQKCRKEQSLYFALWSSLTQDDILAFCLDEIHTAYVENNRTVCNLDSRMKLKN